MKKTAFVTSLILCLLTLSLTKAQTEFIIPTNTYTLSSSEGTFASIADDPNTVKFGEDWTDNTALLNGFFINDPTASFVTHVADKTKTDPGFALGFDFILCGKTMKYFTICASGGIQFGAESGIPQTQSGAWFTNFQNFQNLVTVVTRDTAGHQNVARSIAGQAPVMYLIEGEAGQKVLTVQYHYVINGDNVNVDEWTYQLKVYEASGKIEFIAGDINTQFVNADSTYGLGFGLVENGNLNIEDDPLKTLNLNWSGEGYHKASFVIDEAPAGNWNTSTVYKQSHTNPIDFLAVKPLDKPQSGYTLAFTPPAGCAEKADKFDDEWYGFGTTSVSKTSVTGKITFDKTKVTATEIKSAGTVVAIFSTSETPDYTLSNGTWYRVGDNLSPTSKVLLNAKPSYTPYGETVNFTNNDKAMTFTVNELTGATTYYLHIYAMDYHCTGAPIYSDLCRTFSFTTSIELPQTLSAGLPTTSSVPLTVKPADGLGMVLLKSPNTNALKLSGELNAGDKIGDAEVLTVITAPDATVFNTPFKAGEGAYILAYSVKNPEAESPVYGQDCLSLPVRAAYDTLPTFRFEDETYTAAEANEYGPLPFGWSRETVFPENQRSNAFRLKQIDFEYTCLSSSYPNEAAFWADVVTPAFACPSDLDKITVTFYTEYMEAKGFSMTSHKPTDADQVRIEYSVDGGDWQTVLELSGADEGFPSLNTQKQYPLNTTITQLTPGSIIRIRYSYRSPITDNMVTNNIRMVEIAAGKECIQPQTVQLVDSLTTTNSLTLNWMDNNLPVAPAFVLGYQVYGESTWQYTRIAAGSNRETEQPVEGSLSGLTAGTAYMVKAAAICGSRDSSYYTEPMMVRTAYNLPYTESMAKTGSGATAQTPFDRGVKTYSGTIGGRLTETTETQSGWNQIKTSNTYNIANAVSVGDYVTNAWLTTPAVYIRKNGDFTPKSLTFTLSSFDSDKQKGAQPNYNDTKLKVLVSDNGLYTAANIVKTFEYKDLALDEQTFTIDLTEQEGFLQVAFVFECPTGGAAASENDEGEEKPDTWFLEISNLSIRYDVDVCLPIENLNHSIGVYETPLEWDASASAVEYGIFWKLYSEEEYSAANSAYTKETHYTITGLQDGARYKAIVIAYCDESRQLASEPVERVFRTMTGCHTPENFHVEGITATGADFISTSDQPEYLSYRIIYITPDNGNKSFTMIQESDTLCVRDSLTGLTAYTATTQAVCDDIKSEMSEAIHFTTLNKNDTSAIENVAQLSSLFSVRTQDGQIAIRNLNKLLVRNVTVFNLNGVQTADFRVNSHDDLLLPVSAHHLLVFVRLQTERGMVVYKVYLP